MSDKSMANTPLDFCAHNSREWNFVIAKVASAFASRESATVTEILKLVDGLANALDATMAADKAPQSMKNAVAPVSFAPAVPATPIENAVQNDKVICLCCGEPFTMLKRHLKAEHGLTVDMYRQKFGLPDEMPLVAPSYSARKAEFARGSGLGKHTRSA